MGLYNYDQTIFDLMTLPEGIDRDTLITTILTECSDLEALYPNPEVMKALIGRWAYASNYAWTTLLETTQFEYNPLDNYDRTETRTVHRESEGTATDGGSDSITSADSGSDSLTSADSGTDSADTDITRKNDVAGFEAVSDQYSDRDKETSESSTTTTYGKRNTTTNTYGKHNTTTNTYGKTNTNTLENDETETIRAHGNIGVTTSMQLIQEQRNVAQFNIYDVITDDFKKRYCILVY